MKYRKLNEVLIEWNESPKEDSDNVFLKSEDIKKSLDKYFVYRLAKKGRIQIFAYQWREFFKYKDKVWINGKHVELDNLGYTVENEFEPGKYEVYIEDIDKVTRTYCMYPAGYQLISAFIPESVTRIDSLAFKNCYGITNITIPGSVTEIGNEAFAGCYSLKMITIPNSVTKIGDDAFYDCRNLKTVYVEDINKFNQIEFDNGWSDPRCYGAKLIELKK